MSLRYPSLAVNTGRASTAPPAAAAPSPEIITGGVFEDNTGEPVVSLIVVKKAGERLCGGVANTKEDDRPRICLKGWGECRSHKESKRKEVIPGVYILGPTARNLRAAYQRPMVLMRSLASEACGDFLAALLEGSKRVVAIGILSWVEAEPPPSGDEMWTIEELGQLIDRYNRGDLDASLHNMGIGTPRGEPFDLITRSVVMVEDGSEDEGRYRGATASGVGGPSPNFASAMSEVASEIEDATPSSGISGLTVAPGPDAESIFSFAEIRAPKQPETVEQLAKRLEEAVQDGKRRLGILEPAQRRVSQRLDEWVPEQRRAVEMMNTWEPTQARLAQEVETVARDSAGFLQRFSTIEQDLSYKTDAGVFDLWKKGITSLTTRVTAVEGLTTDMDNYLSNPNELPALATMVNDMDAFVGRDNRDQLRDWMTRQFPALLSGNVTGANLNTGGFGAIGSRRFGSLSLNPAAGARGGGDLAGQLGVLREQMNQMQHQLTEVRQENRLLQNRLQQPNQLGANNLVEMLTAPDNSGEAASQRMVALTERIASLEARGLTEPIRMGDHVFSSVGDVRAFVVKYVGERANFGVLSDLVILLHKTKSPSGLISQATINDEIAASKIRLDTVESNILVSFSIILPRPFDSAGGGVGSSADHPLPSIKTYEQWTAPRVGKKTVISREVRNEAKVIGDRIVAARMAPEATQLFELMRRQSISHWDQLATFIDTNVQTQTMGYKLSEEESWQLTSKCVREAFMALRGQRIHGQDLISDCESKPEQFARAMWAVLLCHQLLDSLFEADVLGHVMMAHVVHEHLLSNKVTSSELETVRVMAAGCQTGLTNVNSDVQRLLSHCNLPRSKNSRGGGGS